MEYMREMLGLVQENLSQIFSMAKSRGFVYPGSEIYGGLANT